MGVNRRVHARISHVPENLEEEMVEVVMHALDHAEEAMMWDGCNFFFSGQGIPDDRLGAMRKEDSRNSHRTIWYEEACRVPMSFISNCLPKHAIEFISNVWPRAVSGPILVPLSVGFRLVTVTARLTSAMPDPDLWGCERSALQNHCATSRALGACIPVRK